MSLKQWGIKLKPGIKLNHNIHNDPSSRSVIIMIVQQYTINLI